MFRFTNKFLFLASCFFIVQQCIYFDDTARPENAPENLPGDYTTATKLLQEYSIRKNNSVREFSEPFISEIPPGKNILIGKIYIFNTPVTREPGFIPGLFNFFHWTTEKYIIGNELLFRPNQETNEQLIVESERILRTLPSIKESAIYLIPDGNGTYTAAVYAHDRFTSNVRFGASGSGGYSLFHMEAGESNLFGRLYNIGASIDRENFLNSFGVYAAQPRLASSRWGLGASYTNSFAEGYQNFSGYFITLNRPFISLSDRNSFHFQLQSSRGVRYSFKGGGIETGQDTQTGQSFPVIYHQSAMLWYGEYIRAFGRLKRLETGLGVSEMNDTYSIIPESAQYNENPVPEREYSYSTRKKYLPQFANYRAIHTKVNLKWGEYGIRRNFRKYFFTEDTYNGTQILTMLRYADPVLGKPDHFTEGFISGSYTLDTELWRNETRVLRKSRRWHAGPEEHTDDLFTAENRAFIFQNFGVFAQRIFVAQGNHLTRKEILLLAEEIPRGIGYRQYLGSAVFLLSHEYRTPPWILGYVSVAGVAFLDFGGIANAVEKISPLPVAGLGIRLMLHEFDDNIFRLDIGLPLGTGSFTLVNALQFGLQHTF